MKYKYTIEITIPEGYGGPEPSEEEMERDLHEWITAESDIAWTVEITNILNK